MTIVNEFSFNRKLVNFIKKKILSFPTLNFLMSSKSSLLKNLYINFWIFFSKKNKSFKQYFFEYQELKKNNIICKLDNKIENLDNKYLDALSQNGILILENALDEIEHKKIIEIFNKILIIQNHNYRSSSSVIRYVEYFNLDDFKFLKSISNFLTKNVYGKILKSEAEFYIHKPIKIPEDIEHGDNNLHIDRFLPNMKILYSPFEINHEGAPFCYALGSHKINENYLSFVKNSKKFNESDLAANQFLLNKMEATCKANTIIVALTSGFHGRKPFLKEIDRKLIFLQYHKSFNKNSLIFG